MATLSEAGEGVVGLIKAGNLASKVKTLQGTSQALGGGLAGQTPLRFPCIIVRLDGGAGVSTVHAPGIKARWRVFVGTQTILEAAVRKGDGNTIGAHEIIARLCVVLHARTLNEVGTLFF